MQESSPTAFSTFPSPALPSSEDLFTFMYGRDKLNV